MRHQVFFFGPSSETGVPVLAMAKDYDFRINASSFLRAIIDVSCKTTESSLVIACFTKYTDIFYFICEGVESLAGRIMTFFHLIPKLLALKYILGRNLDSIGL